MLIKRQMKNLLPLCLDQQFPKKLPKWKLTHNNQLQQKLSQFERNLSGATICGEKGVQNNNLQNVHQIVLKVSWQNIFKKKLSTTAIFKQILEHQFEKNCFGDPDRQFATKKVVLNVKLQKFCLEQQFAKFAKEGNQRWCWHSYRIKMSVCKMYEMCISGSSHLHPH